MAVGIESERVAVGGADVGVATATCTTLVAWIVWRLTARTGVGGAIVGDAAAVTRGGVGRMAGATLVVNDALPVGEGTGGFDRIRTAPTTMGKRRAVANTVFWLTSNHVSERAETRPGLSSKGDLPFVATASVVPSNGYV